MQIGLTRFHYFITEAVVIVARGKSYVVLKWECARTFACYATSIPSIHYT